MNQAVQLLMMSLTVAQEAIGESQEGKLAVAYVIRNRAARSGKSYTDVCLKPYQFSCWNTESPTRMMLDVISEKGFAECECASLEAAYQLVPDPTNGAIFYLNPNTVLASAGKLPSWWDLDGDPASEIRIGRHLFRRHKDDPGVVV